MRIYYTYHGQQQVRDVDRKEILIGRLSPLSAPDIDLGEDPTVSRKHCRIKMTASGCVIEDLRSTNGTVVNNDFVETATVNDNTSIRLGETEIKIELEPQGEPTLQPVPNSGAPAPKAPTPAPAASAPSPVPQSPVAKPKVAKQDPLNPPASPKPSSVLPPKGQKPGGQPAPEAKPAGPASILPPGGPGKSKPDATPEPAPKPVPKPEVKQETPPPVVPPSKAKSVPSSKPIPTKPEAPAAPKKEDTELKAAVPAQKPASPPAKPDAKPALPSKPSPDKKPEPVAAKKPAAKPEPKPAAVAASPADAKADAKFRDSLAELFEVALSFTPELKLEQMLSRVLKRVLKLIPGAEQGAILIDEDTKLVVKASQPEGKVVVSNSLARRVMDEGHGFILERNLEGGSSLNPQLVKVETGMYAPLLSKEKPLGAIFVDDPERSTPYGEEDMQFLLAVSHYVATIVRNHELQSGLVHNSTMLDRVAPKFPAKIQDTLLSELKDNRLKPSGRKDDLPVLFAELKGFESAGSELPADAATEMMSEYYSVLQSALFKYDGSIDRFSGAGVVAVFGAPIADEKANEKAVVAAISMRDAVRDLNVKRVQNGGNIWHLRVGVNLGTVFHGFVGSDERMNFSVVGPGMTRAENFCRGAENGDVLIGPELYQKVFKIVEADRSTVSHREHGDFHCYRVKGLKQK